jgi:myo-inositol 2-dehydrogenase/D-chiro-inositol 1-dehydrogenase
MPSEAQRIALVGCGRQMKKNLLPFLRRIEGHEIAVCVDPDEALGREVQRKVEAPLWVPDIRDVAPGTIDAAVLALPPEPSYRVTSYLVETGTPCFVEKPAGPSSEALEVGRAQAREHGVWVQVGFNFRFAETVAYLHEVSAERRKQPFTLTLDFYSRHPSVPQWGCDTTMEAWLRHNGVHPLDLARWFVGAAVTDVTAHAIPTGHDTFHAVIVLRHENACVSILRLGNETRKFTIRVGLHCLDGTRYTMPSLERVKLAFDEGRPSGALLFTTRNLDHGWARSGFGPELRCFVESLRAAGDGGGAGASAPGLEDALRASELCDRILDGLAAAGDEMTASAAVGGGDGLPWAAHSDGVAGDTRTSGSAE